jgi:hypothetical protein
MGTTTETPDIPATVQQEVERLGPQIKLWQSAQRLWDGFLSLEERESLGDDCYEAYCRLGTVGMWLEVRAVTPPRAVLDVGNRLSLLDTYRYRELLRQLGLDQEFEHAVKSSKLVLCKDPLAVYWQGDKLDVDWSRYYTRWEFLHVLCGKAKRRSYVVPADVGDDMTPKKMRDRKKRLTEVFPDIDAEIDAKRDVAHGVYALTLPPDDIRIFRRDETGELVED